MIRDRQVLRAGVFTLSALNTVSRPAAISRCLAIKLSCVFDPSVTELPVHGGKDVRDLGYRSTSAFLIAASEPVYTKAVSK